MSETKPFLSIIIPCYNCEKTIGRLLSSIVNNINNEEIIVKDDLEIIIVNDKSTDNFLNIAQTFEDRLNIRYFKTIRDFHCPGNTRQIALKYIRGEYFCFIDNDDMFEADGLSKVIKYLKESEETIYTLVTNFREFFPENVYINENGKTVKTEEYYGREFIRDDADTWIHGKFFNTYYTRDVFGCHFMDDQFSHEDVFFNSYNLANLISIGKDYTYYDIFTYKWCHNPDSLSRSFFDDKYLYIDKYLGDYILGASEPFFELFEKDSINKEFCVNQAMMTLLHAYFYHEASVYRLGDDFYKDNLIHIHTLKNKIQNIMGLSINDIVQYIYSMPDRYNSIKEKCFYGSCKFVEFQSFRDFIVNV